MKSFVLLLIIFSLKAHANDSLKASQVINHLRTIGYNGQGFDKLPNKLHFDGWSFEKISDVYYDIRGPSGPSKRNYEYIMEPSGLKEITMSGDVTVFSLYKKDACVEIFEASLKIKAEESLRDTLKDITQKYKLKIPLVESDKWYARNYVKNCKDIFQLNEKTHILKASKATK
jgi:hypothetical protein